MNLNIRFYETAFMPRRATRHCAGYDLFTPNAFTIVPGETKLVKLGFWWSPDDSMVFAKIFDKSGLALKASFNTRAGVIDADFNIPFKENGERHCEWGVICRNEGNKAIDFAAGDKIAQFVLLHYLIADDLETNELVNRSGGFGSTGK